MNKIEEEDIDISFRIHHQRLNVSSSSYNITHKQQKQQEKKTMKQTAGKKIVQKMLFKDSSSILYCRKFCLNAFFLSFRVVLRVYVFLYVSGFSPFRCVFVHVLLMAIVRPFQSKRIIHRTIREKSLPISLPLALTLSSRICDNVCVCCKCTVLGDALASFFTNILVALFFFVFFSSNVT